MNATAKVIGLDIAKNVFVAVGRDTHGKVVLKRTLSRCDVLSTFANMPATTVGIESCAGSHYWARKLCVAFFCFLFLAKRNYSASKQGAGTFPENA